MSHLVARCDIVHLHDSLYLGNVLACRLAKRYGKPVVVTQHIGAIPYKNPLLRGLLSIANRTLARRVLTGCDRCIFISPRVRDYFARFVRFRSPSLYWPNGVDTDRYRPTTEEERREIRARFNCSAARPMLLFVGRFVEKKGLLVLREAARQRPDCDFVFAGWGALDPRGWNLPNVRCLGSLSASELVPYYRAADLLVLPSVGEGFPLVVQEAAACGTPALISRETAEGHPDINAFAYVADPDVAAVVRRLGEILSRRDELGERRRTAAEYARRHWDWERLADRYRALFEELCHVRPITTNSTQEGKDEYDSPGFFG